MITHTFLDGAFVAGAGGGSPEPPVDPWLETPDDYSALVSWWDADHLAGLIGTGNLGASGREWLNRVSGAPDGAQTSSGSRPALQASVTALGGRHAVYFSGNSTILLDLSANLSLTGSFTIHAMVANLLDVDDSTPHPGIPIRGDNASLFAMRLNWDMAGAAAANKSSWYLGSFGTYIVSDTPPTTPGSAKLITLRRTISGGLADYEWFENGGSFSQHAGTALTGTADANRLGGDTRGHIAEIVVYDAAMSDTDIGNLWTRYFAPKYGF